MSVRPASPGAPRAAPRPLRAAGPAAARAAAGTGFVVFVVSHLTWIAVGAAVLAHLLLADEAYPFAARVFLAVPAVILLVEGRAYLKGGMRELPIGVWTLTQYYITFAFPVFFDLPFYDLAGPVVFSAETRVTGAMVIALGALGIWAGIRAGLRAGDRIRRFMLRAVPPSELPARWEDAFLGYEVLVVLLNLALMFVALPAGMQLPASIIFGIEFALGLALALPSRRLEGRTAGFVAVAAALTGLLRGLLDPIFRAAATYLAGRWINTRRFSVGIVVLCMLAYAVLQPVKQSYRKQVWVNSVQREDQVGVAGRVEVWVQALESAYSGDAAPKSDETESLMSRMSELGSVMNVCQVVPNRIDYLMGQSFVQALYSPIPRFIWPDKPTTQQTVQQYAVTFGLQTAEGAQTTAITFPLLVEGWWNFGWVGVALVGFLAGLWSGAAQRTFAGDHWAMRALGYAYLSQTGVAYAVVLTYASVFQNFVGRMIAVWGVYWLARTLSGRRRTAQPLGGRARRRAVVAPAVPAALRRV